LLHDHTLIKIGFQLAECTIRRLTIGSQCLSLIGGCYLDGFTPSAAIEYRCEQVDTGKKPNQLGDSKICCL